MDLKNVGGTPGGARTFLLGLIMAIVGGYLLLQEVTVHGGYWNWGFAGGYGRSFSVIDAKLIALRRCENYSPIPVCTILWCRPGG